LKTTKIIQNPSKSMSNGKYEKKMHIHYGWILHHCFACPFVMFLAFLAPDWQLGHCKAQVEGQ
jgi:hypothetical protein